MADDANASSQQGLKDLATIQQSGVRNIGLLIQAIQTRFPGQFSPAPANATALGTPNQVAYDSGFFYICVGVNTWKRVAISTF